MARITPKNRAGDGEAVNVLITCRPLKVFWGLAQTYCGTQMPKDVVKLECCKIDLINMMQDHRDLGFDILISCLDATGVGVDATLKHIVSLVRKVKATDLVCYISGHGFEPEDTSKTWLLLRDDLGSADWDKERNNLCIQDAVEKIAKEADSTTFVVMIVDACRETLRTVELAKRRSSDEILKMKISGIFKQIVIWFATSSGRMSIAGSGEMAMSRFSGALHQELVQIATGGQCELYTVPGNRYQPGVSFLKTRVHDAVSKLVLSWVVERMIRMCKHRNIGRKMWWRPSPSSCLQRPPCRSCVIWFKCLQMQIHGGRHYWRIRKLCPTILYCTCFTVERLKEKSKVTGASN